MTEDKKTTDQDKPSGGSKSVQRQVLLEPSFWCAVLLLIFGGALLLLIMFDAPALSRLSEPAYARGVITWIISLSTIGIAFVLIYQAFFSTESSDDRFRRGREVFTGLMGVLGTIVGFYFGSTEQPGARPSVADFQFVDSRLITFVSGGVAPFRYSLAYGDVKPTIKLSTNGWIDEALTGPPKPGTEVKVTVIDSRNQEVSKTGTVPGPTPPPAGAPAAPTPKPSAPTPPGGS